MIQASGEDDFPYSDWTAPYRTPAGLATILAAHGESFDLLLGRRAYDIWSGFWPKAPKSPMADSLNAATKYVVTHRPESLRWGPFKGIGPEIMDGVRGIKAKDGSDVILWGSSRLTSALLEHGLADEVMLIVYPVLLGQGKRFFAEVLRHAHQRWKARKHCRRASSSCLQGRWTFAEPEIRRRPQMRFMMMVIDKGNGSTARDAVSSSEAVAKMMEYNKTLQKAGVLLALDGLFPPSTGARISLADGKAKVTDGPFLEAKEVIGGYWIIQVRSREEAIEWAKRAPMSNNEVIEVRQIHEMPDFPEDVQKAAEGFEHQNALNR